MISRLKSKSEFTKNVFTLAVGTAAAQGINLLISPLLTRLFTPADFGVYTWYLSTVSVLVILATGRYDIAILLPKQKRRALGLVALSILYSVCFFCVSFLVILLFGEKIIMMFNGNSALKNALNFIPFGVFSLAIFQALNYWYNRTQQYRLLAIVRIARVMTFAILAVVIGYSKIVHNGMLFGDLFGYLIILVPLFLFLRKSGSWSIMPWKFKYLKLLSLKYIHFPKYQVPSGLTEKIAFSSPVFFITAFYSASLAGLYALSYRVIAAPANLITTAIADVYKQQASKQINETGNCRALFLQTTKKLLLLSIIPFTVLFIIAPFAFQYIFGPSWYESGVITRILAFMFLFQFVVSPTSSTIILFEKQRIDLAIQLCLLGLISLVFWYTKTYFDNFKVSLVAYVIIYVLKYIVEFCISYNLSGGTKK